LQHLPEKRWAVRETTQAVQAVHRFHSAKPKLDDESDDLSMITRVISSLLPEKMHTFQAGSFCVSFRHRIVSRFSRVSTL
jgi:hypothetical protein